MQVEMVDSRFVEYDHPAVLLPGLVGSQRMPDRVLKLSKADAKRLMAGQRSLEAGHDGLDRLQSDTWQATRVHDGEILGMKNLYTGGELDVQAHPDVVRALSTAGTVTGLVQQLYQGRKLFGKTKVAFEYDDGLVVERPLRLPLLRIHCPHHAGCTATYSFAVTGDQKVDMKVGFLGLAASGATIGSFRIEPVWTTSGGKCLEYVIPARVAIRSGYTTVDGSRVSYGLSVTVTLVGNDEPGELREIPEPSHSCQKPASTISKERRLGGPIKISEGSHRQSFTAGRTLAGSSGLDLEVFGKTLTLGLAYSRSYSAVQTRTYDLSSGATYLAYSAGNGPTTSAAVDEILWTTVWDEA